MAENDYCFHEGDEQSYLVAERLLLTNNNIDISSRPELPENEIENSKNTLSALLNLGLNNELNKDGTRRVKFTLKDMIFKSVHELAPELGLTMRQRYNLSSDIGWKKYCLIPQTTAPKQPLPYHKG